MLPPHIRTRLICPICRGRLRATNDALLCDPCGHRYSISRGVPILLPPGSTFRANLAQAERALAGRSDAWHRRLLRWYVSYNPALTTWINDRLFAWINESSSDQWILNLGSGIGLFDARIEPHVSMINLDVSIKESVDMIADAHRLPFEDESLDGVYSNAVLEHVQRPWVVAREIYRVVRPGGKVFINVPFLNIIHDAHDYFRFTDKGLEVLFEGFRRLDGGVSAGPSSFLGPFLVEYLLYFVPSRYLKAVLRPLVGWALLPLKYCDYPITRDPALRLTADAFFFVGIKEGTCRR